MESGNYFSKLSPKTKMVLRAVAILVGLVSIVIGVYVGFLSSPKCHSVYPGTINHLGTKTPYLFTDETKAHHPDNDPACSAEQIWMIIRHGSRLPGAECITKIREDLPKFRDVIIANHAAGRGSLCPESIADLKSWEPNPGFQESKEKYLISQGEIELEGIAKRYKERFPQLFNVSYSKEAFKLKYTKTQRAEASANTFAKALFDNHKDVWYPTAVKADPILRFYKACEKWQKEVDDNPEAYKERDMFGKSKYFETALENMKNRLGFESDFNLTLEQIEGVYTACQFETAWHPEKLSKWCSIFEENDYHLFEYRSDVKYYWIDGYGYELTYKHACAPVRDVIEHFKDRISKPKESPNVIAYFTHSGTLLKLVSRLGLFKDEIPLLGDNYHLHSNRKWRTSQIDKFATNLAFVLFKCPSGYKVGTYFQEKPVNLEACEHSFCDFNKFKTNLENTIDICDVKTMCKIEKDKK